MTAAAIAMDAPEALEFRRSESRAVGFAGKIIESLRNNAPRVVAGLKLAADICMGLTMNPFLIGYAALSGAGRIVSLLYGSKSAQQQLAQEAKSQSLQELPDNSWLGGLKKMFRPREYPVESSSGLSAAGEMSFAGYSLTELYKQTPGSVFLTVCSALALWSYANMLFGKEATKKEELVAEKEQTTADQPESLVFSRSESKTVGVFGRIRQMMKDNPVFVSSLVQLGISFTLALTGVMGDRGPMYLLGACLFIVANTLQALFVRKREFNIEGAKEEMELQQRQPQPAVSAADRSFVDKYLVERGTPQLGARPA